MSQPSDTSDELARLQARVTELEAELAEQSRTTNAIVARSQEKLYWLERWQIDLDKLMQRRSARLALESLKHLRSVFRAARKAQRRLGNQR
jgi:uncharacterized coiled-coil protein SlyX